MISLLFCIGIFRPSTASGADLVEPRVVSSSNGLLDITITLEKAIHETPNFSLTTRAFNGTIPGPTLRLKPGDAVSVNFVNNLPDQGLMHINNALSSPDESNLHFHGLFISGELPSDDSTHVVKPGDSYKYMFTLPEEHMGGTHWLHPHRHGSTALQVGGGAISAVIVEDDNNILSQIPSQIQTAKEIVMVVKLMDLSDTRSVASKSRDSLFDSSSSVNANDGFITINGQYNPSLRLVVAGEWVRLRIIYAAWRGGNFDFAVQGCEMQLIAKDGVYINDNPRRISMASIPLGGRADIMLRCMEPSTIYDVMHDGQKIATIETSSDPAASSNDLTPWTPSYPSYLQDLQSTDPTPGCSCTTQLGTSGGINGVKFDEERILHQAYLGDVVERRISANDHPYHQHVYPFQLVGGFQESEYIHRGDWHDTFEGRAIIRYNPTYYETKIMLHCHKLKHEDEGMMAIDRISAKTSDEACTCSPAVDSDTWVQPAIIVGSILVFFILLLLLFCVWARRTGRKICSRNSKDTNGR